jgi:L-fuconolactonase
MIADTHIHVWNFKQAYYLWLEGDTSILNRTYNIEEIETERKNLNITSGVLVQAANNLEDTNWMLEVVTTHEWIKGVVGWLPLTDPAATQKLLEEKYLKNKYFKGVRHLIHDEADPKWLLQPTVIESLQLLAAYDISYDVVGVLPAHIETVLKIAELVPNLRMIFDHLNAPSIASKEKFGKWGVLMKEAVQHKNIYAKISGLGTVASKGDKWSNDDLKPYIEFAIQNFGVNRCFCGGDWPVSLLAGSYTKTWTAYQQIINELLPEEEAVRILYTNAQQFYKL